MKDSFQNQDWPYLNKYKEENKKLKTVKEAENRIIFMGDSITEFWTVLSPEFFTEKAYVNRGISGQTTPQMLIRFRADVINLKPHTVVILAGANDIAGNTGSSTLEMITNNIFSMVELAQANQIKIILCSILPAYDYPWKTGSFPAEKISTLNTSLKKYAINNEILYLDYYSVMVDERKGMKSIYTDDGVHPNKSGYEVMESIVKKAILQVLSNK